jgi:hypothetical protein
VDKTFYRHANALFLTTLTFSEADKNGNLLFVMFVSESVFFNIFHTQEFIDHVFINLSY